MPDLPTAYDILPAHLKPKASRLLARIHRKYQTRSEVVKFGDVSFCFTRIKDPEAVLDEVAEEESRRTKIRKDGTISFKGEPLRMPYWAELWESAEAIGAWLVENSGPWAGGSGQGSRASGQGAVGSGQKKAARTVSSGESTARAEAKQTLAPTPTKLPSALPTAHSALRTALDLGCGMGLAGCVAAGCGYDVTFADIEAPSLLFAELNALPFPNVTCRKTNWQTDDLNRKFDLIIGADILYERTQWEFLDPFWKKHLSENGVVLLGEPGRPTSEPFPDFARERGWTVSIDKRKVPNRAEPIRLIQLTK